MIHFRTSCTSLNIAIFRLLFSHILSNGFLMLISAVDSDVRNGDFCIMITVSFLYRKLVNVTIVLRSSYSECV